MSILKYLLLGLVQGIAEALPISSSGHLLIVQHLLNFKDIDYSTIATITNFGSLIAVILVFWNDIKELIAYFFKYLKTKNKIYKDDYNYCWMIVLGCIPAGLVGLIVAKLDLLEKIEGNVKIVGASLIFTSIMLFLVRKKRGKKTDEDIKKKEALTVGFMQILGVFPGISRSGSTISGGLFSGLSRDAAFKYSFILYIPMSIAATGLELLDIHIEKGLIVSYLLAAVVACIFTFFTIKWFKKIFNKGRLAYFSIYLFIVGLLVVLFLK